MREYHKTYREKNADRIRRKARLRMRKCRESTFVFEYEGEDLYEYTGDHQYAVRHIKKRFWYLLNRGEWAIYELRKSLHD